MNFVGGGLSSQFILNKPIKIGETEMFHVVMISSIIFGMFLILFLRGAKYDLNERRKKVKKEILSFLKNDLAGFFFIIFYLGISVSFFYGKYPILIGRKWTGFCFVIFGALQIVGAFLSKVLGTKIPKKILFFFSFLLGLGGYLSSYFSENYSHPYLHFASMALFAFSDSILMSIVFAVLSESNPENRTSPIILRFLQCVGASVGFVVSIYASFKICLIVNASFLGLGSILFLFNGVLFCRKLDLDDLNTSSIDYDTK